MRFDDRTKELIAVGASIAANCQSCVEYHVAKAAELGLGPDEVSQAVDVGRMVRRGAAAKVDKVAEGLLHQEHASAAPPAPARGGCGS
jgi:AhpD family alkylhydroperoxidase